MVQHICTDRKEIESTSFCSSFISIDISIWFLVMMNMNNEYEA
jgi:hypothetical protein